MNIKKVAVLGAGAVGSYVIWGLSNNKKITLGVVADGERKASILWNVLPNESIYILNGPFLP